MSISKLTPSFMLRIITFTKRKRGRLNFSQEKLIKLYESGRNSSIKLYTVVFDNTFDNIL